MVIMPLLSQMIFTAMITSTFIHTCTRIWYRHPPPSWPQVIFKYPFIHEWNSGFYPKMTRYRNKRLPRRVNHNISSKPERLDNNINSLGNKTPILHLPLQNSQTLFRSARPSDNNKHILAMLYTLTTPTNERTFNFGTDSKRICIETRALVCISTRKENFITLKEVKNIQINGIATGLPLVGIGLLNGPYRMIITMR